MCKELPVIKIDRVVNKCFCQDSAASIKKKLKKAFCEPGNIADNGILSFCRYVIIPVVLRGEPFVIERAPENGGNVSFTAYEVLGPMLHFWSIF
jgi:hypothetical protein